MQFICNFILVIREEKVHSYNYDNNWSNNLHQKYKLGNHIKIIYLEWKSNCEAIQTLYLQIML